MDLTRRAALKIAGGLTALAGCQTPGSDQEIDQPPKKQSLREEESMSEDTDYVPVYDQDGNLRHYVTTEPEFSQVEAKDSFIDPSGTEHTGEMGGNVDGDHIEPASVSTGRADIKGDVLGEVPSWQSRENHTSTTELSALTLSTDPRSVDISGQYAATVGKGLSIIDISNPYSMEEVSFLGDSEVGDYGVLWLDDYILAASTGDSAIHTVDVSDPENPTLVNTFTNSTMGPARKMAYRNDTLFVSTGDTSDTFVTVDVSDRENPSLLGSVSNTSLSNRCFEVALSTSHAYVTNKDNNVLTSIDVSDPTSPAIADTITLGEPYGLVRMGDSLIVSLTDNNNGIASVDISDPTTLTLVSRRTDNPINSIYGMASEKGWIYGADKDAADGFHSIAANSPFQPWHDSSVSSANLNSPYDVSLSGGFGFVVSRGDQNIVSFGTHNEYHEASHRPEVYIGKLEGSGVSSVSLSWAEKYDKVLIDFRYIENTSGASQDIGMQANGVTDGAYAYRNDANTRSTSQPYWLLKNLGNGNRISGELKMLGRWDNRRVFVNSQNLMTNSAGDMMIRAEHPNITPPISQISIVGGSGSIDVDARVYGMWV